MDNSANFGWFGEDPNYPACELNSQGPASMGWRSSGRPPHELLLRLSSVTSIHQIQLLAHHQLVPASVEVLVTGGIEIEGAQTPCGAAYISVGNILLAAPEDHASTRELRSASLPEPTAARFVKLRMSPPHPPAKEDDQIALMAVNILGTKISEDKEEMLSGLKDFSPYDDLSFVMYVDIEIADIIRSLDSRKKVAVKEERFEYARRLKNAIASLNGVGLRIGRWRLRQRMAALQAQYELATEARDRITAALEGLNSDEDLNILFEIDGPEEQNKNVSELEYDFSHHLNTAVMCVNYTTSIDVPSPRNNASADVNYSSYLAPTPMQEQPTRTDEPILDNNISNLEQSFNSEHNSNSEQYNLEQSVKNDCSEVLEAIEAPVKRVEVEDIPNVLDENDRRVIITGASRRSLTPGTSCVNSNGVRKRHKSAGPRTTFEDYEETPIPTLKHSQTNEYLRVCQQQVNEDCGNSTISATSSNTVRVQTQHKLNERERKINALAILIFGENLVEKFYSKNYLDKEEGLNLLKSELQNGDSIQEKSTPNKMARAAAILLQRPLKEKVFSVFSLTNEVVKVLFQEYVTRSKVCAAEVGRCLDRILPELMKASGDPAPRVASTAQHTILTLADCPPVRSLHTIPQMLVRPMPPSTHPRLALAKLIMLEQLIQSHGISTDKQSGLTARRIAEAGAAGVCAGGAGREVAERVLLVAYARAPRLVRAQLPPDDAVTRRNLVYRHLFHQFDRIDMEKLLNQAPSDCKTPDKSMHESFSSVLETGSVTRSSYSCMTSSVSRLTSSVGRMTSSMSITTLAPSTASSATSKTKSSLKQTPTRRSSSRSSRDIPFYGFNKLRIDSAASPKHSPRNTPSGEKVHFVDAPKDEVILRRSNRSTQNRHSMIHYDHNRETYDIKERPTSNIEPLLLIDVENESTRFIKKPTYNSLEVLNSPKTKIPIKRGLFIKESFESNNSLESPCLQLEDSFEKRLQLEDSPRTSLRLDNKPKNTQARKSLQLDDSPKITQGRKSSQLDDSPKTSDGRKSFQLDDSPRNSYGRKSLRLEDGQMDESGYYSPGEKGGKSLCRSKSENMSDVNDGYDGSVDISSGANTPEPNNYSTSCEWCGRSVRTDALESHRVKRCVILATCPECTTTTHARHLHSHLLEECDKAVGWRRCALCGAALRGDEGCYHARCTLAGSDEWKCPYCLLNVIARDEPWQRHLSRCPRNPRTSSLRS